MILADPELRCVRSSGPIMAPAGLSSVDSIRRRLVASSIRRRVDFHGRIASGARRFAERFDTSCSTGRRRPRPQKAPSGGLGVDFAQNQCKLRATRRQDALLDAKRGFLDADCFRAGRRLVVISTVRQDRRGATRHFYYFFKNIWYMSLRDWRLVCTCIHLPINAKVCVLSRKTRLIV